MRNRLIALLVLFTVVIFSSAQAQTTARKFEAGKNTFLLDGEPFVVKAAELHYTRIPQAYWEHRIEMCKALGMNTICIYIFWNIHEQEEGKFDFSGQNDIAAFCRAAQKHGMYVIVRPGPYVCAEWEMGGLPWWLLKKKDVALRTLDPYYMERVGIFMKEVGKQLAPLQVNKGGNIIMVQVENEYGSYGNDRIYMKWMHNLWRDKGIEVPFYTADGATPYMLEAGTLPGVAIGLDPAASKAEFDEALKVHPDASVFCSELYPGCLTHGGTNFGFWAGANSPQPGTYQPDVTSYDYDAPINEMGQATPKYMALRELTQKYSKKKLAPIPDPIPTITFPATETKRYTSICDNLPAAKQIVQPVPMEMMKQYEGMILYRTKLIGHKSGKLRVDEVHDYATVFLNGRYIGSIDRTLGQHTIDLPVSNVENPVLDILVESMGRINFAAQMIDRKGITDRVTLNGMTLMNWEAFNIPMSSEYVSNLKESDTVRPGMFFKTTLQLDKAGDCYIDLKDFTKGLVYVNGHNLGRFWNVGPQYRLYCPGVWLKEGTNEIIIFDMHQTEPGEIQGVETLE